MPLDPKVKKARPQIDRFEDHSRRLLHEMIKSAGYNFTGRGGFGDLLGKGTGASFHQVLRGAQRLRLAHVLESLVLLEKDVVEFFTEVQRRVHRDVSDEKKATEAPDRLKQIEAQLATLTETLKELKG